MAGVYIAYDRNVKGYPDGSYSYSPDTKYPEYPWGTAHISSEKNEVYALVRECFRISGYDRIHYGTAEWNPLGEFIRPGSTVLVKPNWVSHKNKNKDVNDNLACMVTNPSVIRAVVDFVAIALQGKGRIILGDAPMQGTDLDALLSIAGYGSLFKFFRQQGLDLEIADLRKYSRGSVHKGVMSAPRQNGNNMGSCIVDMGARSMHAEKDHDNPAYKVTDYKQADTMRYHSDGRHCYEVSRAAIEADVIINVPKPKTHRLAGMTAAVKNFVGITYEKACLPHRIEGDKAHGGDAYLKRSIWKRWMHQFDEKRTDYSVSGRYKKAWVCDLGMKACYVAGALTTGDKYRIGSWYGNDTIWRTAVDLNHIVMYADKQGKLQDTQQRAVLTIADTVICGQGNGPVEPFPKKLGMVMMSENTLLFDRVMCEIMGFAADKFPMFRHMAACEKFGYSDRKHLESERIYGLNLAGGGIKLTRFTGCEEWTFEAHSCWKGHIEKED